MNEKFNAYYYGQMNAEEIAAFEEKLKSLEVLKAYDAYRVAQNVIHATHADAQLEEFKRLGIDDEDVQMAYVAGTIEPGTSLHAEIEARQRQDENYREKIADFREMEASLIEAERLGVGANFNLKAEEGAKVRSIKGRNRQPWFIAAAILLLFSLGWYFLRPKGPTSDMVLAFQTAVLDQVDYQGDLFKLNSNNMSGAPELVAETIDLTAVEQALNAKNYQKANTLLSSLKETESGTWTEEMESLQHLRLYSLLHLAGENKKERQEAISLLPIHHDNWVLLYGEKAGQQRIIEKETEMALQLSALRALDGEKEEALTTLRSLLEEDLPISGKLREQIKAMKNQLEQ